jgi:hypothetical protein
VVGDARTHLWITERAESDSESKGKGGILIGTYVSGFVKQ